jgi:hypothetical protein
MNFAILAPVPLEHLQSALLVLESRPYVSFGSQRFEFFRDIDSRRLDQDVPVLIYPSHEDTEAKLTYEVGWLATYIGAVEAETDKQRDENDECRPGSTAQYPTDNSTGWAVFWRVRGLQELAPERRVPIRNLNKHRTGRGRSGSPPRGPEMIERPEWV